MANTLDGYGAGPSPQEMINIQAKANAENSARAYFNSYIPQSYKVPDSSQFTAYDPNISADQMAQLDDYNKRLRQQRDDLVKQRDRWFPGADRDKADASISQIDQQMNDLASTRMSADAAMTGEKRATDMQSRQIDPGAYGLMRSAAEGNAPSQAQLMLKSESENLANVARRQGNQMFNQNQSMVNSARTYNPGMARAAMFQNASQQADLGGKTLEGQQSLAGQYAAMRAQEMAAARGAYGQYALGQQQQNDAAAQQMRANSMNYQQLRQQGAAQQAAANRDKATLQNQSVISQKDIDMKKYIADQQADTSLFDTLIPW
jgi:hypothetical protein